MYGIFRIRDDNRAVIDKDIIKLIPELRKVTEEELIYIILVYDWFDSPIRKMPLEMRKTSARRKLWKDLSITPEENPVVKKAIEAYKSICYDPIRSSIDAIKIKIEYLNHSLLTDQDITLTKAKDIIGQLSFFNDKLYSLEQEVKTEDITHNEIKGQLKLGRLEFFQRKQQEAAKLRKISME